MLNTLDAGKIANEILSGFSWTSKGDASVGPWLAKKLAEMLQLQRKAAIEECAKVAEKFVHTRRDCEAGTTTIEIAEDIRKLANSSNGDEK